MAFLPVSDVTAARARTRSIQNSPARNAVTWKTSCVCLPAKGAAAHPMPTSWQGWQKSWTKLTSKAWPPISPRWTELFRLAFALGEHASVTEKCRNPSASASTLRQRLAATGRQRHCPCAGRRGRADALAPRQRGTGRRPAHRRTSRSTPRSRQPVQQLFHPALLSSTLKRMRIIRLQFHGRPETALRAAETHAQMFGTVA